MTKDEWRPIVALLVGAYGPERFTPEGLVVWFEMLKDLKPSGVRWSVEEMIRTQPFPSVAEVCGIYAAEKARRAPKEHDYPEGHPERIRLGQERLERKMRTYQL